MTLLRFLSSSSIKNMQQQPTREINQAYDKDHNQIIMEHRQLLYNLKTTVETVFLNSKYFGAFGISNDGLIRLHMCIEQIFADKFRIHKAHDVNSPNLWHFIEGLSWINPLITTTKQLTSIQQLQNIPSVRIRDDRALAWIYEMLSTRKLSHQINYLVSDIEHLNACYDRTAFLQNQNYQQAFLICLRALENNQPNLLSQIDCALYKNNTAENLLLHHKRSTSHPDFSYVPKMKSDNNADNILPNATDSIEKTHLAPHRQQLRGSGGKLKRKKLKQKEFISLKLRPWRSLPDIRRHVSFAVRHQSHRSRSKTISQPIGIPIGKLSAGAVSINDYIKSHSYTLTSDLGSSCCNPSAGTSSTSNNDPINDLIPVTLIKCDDIKIYFDQKFTTESHNKAIANEANQSLLSPPNLSGTNNKSQPKNFFSFIPRNRTSPTSVDITLPTTNSSGIGCTNYESLGQKFGSAPSEFVNQFLPMQGEKIKKHHPFDSPAHMLDVQYIGSGDEQYNIMESIDPSSSASAFLDLEPLSIVGQSLTSFLQQAGRFSRANSELERENAHFSVSEAMISTIEQIKWRNVEKLRLKKFNEIETLRTGARRKSKTNNHNKPGHNWAAEKSYHSADDKDNTPSLIGESFSNSGNSYSSQSSISTISSANFSISDSSDDDGSNYLQRLSVSTHSINDHTAYAEWGENHFDTLSAESVALSLIAKFSDKQLPKASELLWLVSEHDVPQKMLPIPPHSRAINPDEIYKLPFTRGTRDWAPPRPQIIFTRHPAIDRKKQLQSQNHRCAGCGMKVAVAYAHRFRYCEYIGKFFCTGCHRNHISTIPARVLDRWNFTSYPVSVFSYRLLEQIWTFPLFRVTDLHCQLYDKVKSLQMAKKKREQLKFIQDFIVSCRFADEYKNILNGIPSYTTNDPDIWSMGDFVSVKNGCYTKDMNVLIVKCECHVFQCELCTARGFICELCPKKQVIFPWQLKIKRCEQCGVCVHERCWKNNCTKCQRLKKRQLTNYRK